MSDNPFAPSDRRGFGAHDDPWAHPDDLEPLKAERGQRFFAAMLDNVAVVVGMLPILVMPIRAGEAAMLTAMAFGTLWYLGVLVLNWGLIATRGQTLGKMAMGIRIVTDDGGPVDFVKGVVVRNWLFTVVNAFVGVLSLIDVVFIFGDDKQCLHDKVAQTIVVDAAAWNPYRDGDPGVL
jgi:uncharacterized RDD family membrane protein YckC